VTAPFASSKPRSATSRNAVFEELDEPFRLDGTRNAHECSPSGDLGIDRDHPRSVTHGTRLGELGGAALREREVARTLAFPSRDAIGEAGENGEESASSAAFGVVGRFASTSRTMRMSCFFARSNGVDGAGIETDGSDRVR